MNPQVKQAVELYKKLNSPNGLTKDEYVKGEDGKATTEVAKVGEMTILMRLIKGFTPKQHRAYLVNTGVNL